MTHLHEDLVAAGGAAFSTDEDDSDDSDDNDDDAIDHLPVSDYAMLALDEE